MHQNRFAVRLGIVAKDRGSGSGNDERKALNFILDSIRV
jgi:hypothetical protein